MIINKPTKKKKISRYAVLSIIMLIIFGAITFKLIYLQILNHEDYKEKANVTSTRFESEKAPRGRIYDQEGNILADNINTYTLSYTTTDDATNNFYSTMSEIFKIFKENNESIQDNMSLKIDSDGNIYFEYTASDKESQNYQELRFKKDRGFDDTLKKNMFPDVEELSDEESAKLDAELLKITPEEMFYQLAKKYSLIELIDPNYKESKEKKQMYDDMSGKEIVDLIKKQGYSLEEIREFMVIKDAIKMQSFKGYKAVTIADNIQKNTALIIQQKLINLPGISVNLSPIRYYPYGALGSSVLGYVSSINSSEEEKYELRGYDASTDLIGKAGIESAFEDQLKGVKGGATVKVNSQGRKTEELFKLESYPGNDVHLTIDRDIQYAAENALADGIQNIQENGSDRGYRYANATRGALVAVEVKTGRILSLVSYPGFDPNLFTTSGKLTAEEIRNYFNPDLEAFGTELIQRMGLNKTLDDIFPPKDGAREDKYDLYPKPFYNYATMARIPPGSTFKPLTAIAGLETGVIDPNTLINDTGKFDAHPETFGSAFAPKCLLYTNYGYGHGSIDVKKALEVSCNYFFYETAYRLYKYNGGKIDALDAIAKYAYQFGLGMDPNSKANPSTGIEIQENFGQTYNFVSFRRNLINYGKFELVDYLESGDYKGIITNFVPFDIKVLDDDTEEVKNAKQSIKDEVANYLGNVGTDDNKNPSEEEFTKDVKKDVKTIIEHSDRYKKNVKDYEAKTGKTVNLDNQADIVSNIIAQFTVHDKSVEITSPAELINASIGQGMHTFTPLQLAGYVSTIANGGTRYKLHLVDKITDNDGNVVQQFEPEVLNKIEMKQSTIDAVKEGMSRVNEDDGGTAKIAFTGFPIRTAGKTGTADFSNTQNEVGRAPYATYVSFAPVDDPEIAVVAVVFDGGHGGSIAPAVRAVYEAYFKDTLLQMDPDYAYKSQSFQKYVLDNPYRAKTDTEAANNEANGSETIGTETQAQGNNSQNDTESNNEPE